MRLLIKKVHPDAIIPARQSRGASGFDLHARLDAPRTVMMGRRAVIPTGIAVEVETFPTALIGWDCQVRPRSGLLARHGVFAHLGTIDEDYRGEVAVTLENLGDEHYIVRPGDRIAQLVVCMIAFPVISVVEQLSPTDRGTQGHGSTGR